MRFIYNFPAREMKRFSRLALRRQAAGWTLAVGVVHNGKSGRRDAAGLSGSNVKLQR